MGPGPNTNISNILTYGLDGSCFIWKYEREISKCICYAK